MMNLAEYRNRNTRLADFLPWAALAGEGVVLNKDGSLQRTARFRGPDLDSALLLLRLKINVVAASDSTASAFDLCVPRRHGHPFHLSGKQYMEIDFFGVTRP